MKQAGYDMLYLSACTLNGMRPDSEKIAGMDLDKLYQMCQFHSLTSIVCDALETAGVKPEQKWIEAKAKAVRKTVLLDAERQNILDFMEQNRIWYMPMKGIILKEFYPKLGIRQMADNDILYDGEYQMQVASFMQNRGYLAEDYGKGNHDVFQKPPIYNFELHRALFSESVNIDLFEYYADVKQRLKKDSGNQYGFYFTDEDFYIYMIAHEYKHYRASGTGLRSLMDDFVYLRAKDESMDWDYIETELQKLGIAQFEQKSRTLSRKIFLNPDGSTLTAAEREMLEEYLFSGTYGTIQNAVSKRMKAFQSSTGKVSKFRYLWSRVFPDMDFYKRYFPFFYRHKWLLPIGWIYRCLRGLTVKNRKIRLEIAAVRKIDK